MCNEWHKSTAGHYRNTYRITTNDDYVTNGIFIWYVGFIANSTAKIITWNDAFWTIREEIPFTLDEQIGADTEVKSNHSYKRKLRAGVVRRSARGASRYVPTRTAHTIRHDTLSGIRLLFLGKLQTEFSLRIYIATEDCAQRLPASPQKRVALTTNNNPGQPNT
jgi:hypothetical protein